MCLVDKIQSNLTVASLSIYPLIWQYMKETMYTVTKI